MNKLKYHPLRSDTLVRNYIFQYEYSDLNIMAKINLKTMISRQHLTISDVAINGHLALTEYGFNNI